MPATSHGSTQQFDAGTVPAILIFVALLLASAPRTARAVPFDGNPKILLHSMSVNAKNVCDRARLGDCQTATTAATVGEPRFVYLLGVRGHLPTLSAVECGLIYQDGLASGQSDGVGIDIFSWTRCAALDFASPAPRAWPAPGGGNIIIYDAVQACQTGETAVMGYFYLTAYSPDALHLVARPSSDRAGVADCGAVETPVAGRDLGSIRFTASGGTDGCNPCLAPCPDPPMFPPAQCEVTVATNTAFPTIRVHDGNNHRMITVRNGGGQRMTGQLTLSSPHFRMWSGIDSYSLMPYESKEFWITYQPSDVGDHEALLSIGSGCPTLRFTGSAVPYADCYVVATNAQFPETRIGEYRDQWIYVENRGPGPVSGAIELDACSPDFSLVGDTTFSLAAGATKQVGLRFAPTRVERQECEIRSSTFCFAARVFGYGYVDQPIPPACSVNPTVVDFDTVIVGQVADGRLHATNTGGGTLRLQIAPDCPEFRAHGSFPSRMDLFTGETGVIRLEFLPTAPGPFTCQLQMAECAPVTLAGWARLPGPGALAPASIDFGTIATGSASERSFEVTNTAGERIAGTIRSNRPEFVLVGGTGYDLAPGSSATFRVRFESAVAGEFRGSLDAGTNSSMLPLAALAELPTPVTPSTWSAIKSRFGR